MDEIQQQTREKYQLNQAKSLEKWIMEIITFVVYKSIIQFMYLNKQLKTKPWKIFFFTFRTEN